MSRQVRRKPKKDANHKAVVNALRQAGAYVHNFGAVDLLVGYKGLWYLLEIKDGAKIPSARKLTKDEIFFILECKNRAPIHVVESVEQALCTIGALE